MFYVHLVVLSKLLFICSALAVCIYLFIGAMSSEVKLLVVVVMMTMIVTSSNYFIFCGVLILSGHFVFRLAKVRRVYVIVMPNNMEICRISLRIHQFSAGHV